MPTAALPTSNPHYEQARTATPLPQDVSEGTVEAARTSLPVGKKGETTSGWIMDEGNKGQPVRSGIGKEGTPERQAYQQSLDHLQSLGPRYEKFLPLAHHAEVKVAVNALLSGQPDHQVMVIDRPVCGRFPPRLNNRRYCDELLQELYRDTPKTLTVVERDGQRVTYPKKDAR
ncbi:hypothetical protein GCM10009754_73920 [Amycolatopsis minnesotensis]|uniref:Uncharacterized protein n=1 Tax=Amycolatopsis minnesotensis TaxID=337894 RepID=A0ABN2SFC9_9PSEU